MFNIAKIRLMKKKLLIFTMALLAITSTPLLASCGDDGDEPEKVPEQGTKGIHKIEATFSGDTENWTATSQYVGFITDKTFSELNYETTGAVAYGPIYDENTGLTAPEAVMNKPVNVIITTNQECERLALQFGCYYRNSYSDGADKSSTLTVNFKGYVNGKLTNTYSKTFTAGQYAAVFFNSVKHSTDGENIVENN